MQVILTAARYDPSAIGPDPARVHDSPLLGWKVTLSGRGLVGGNYCMQPKSGSVVAAVSTLARETTVTLEISTRGSTGHRERDQYNVVTTSF